MCLLCIMNNFLKHLLLPNRWANLDQTWQEYSLGGLLKKLFTEFDSIKNSGCHGNEIEFFKQFFKNLLLWNHWSDFEIISQECFFGDPLQNCLRNFDPSINMALVNGGFLHYRDMKKFLKNLLLWNCWSDFEIISQKCSLGDLFQKLFAKFWSVYKHGSGEWGLLALKGHEEILKKSCSPKLLVRFWNNFTGMFFGWPFSKIVRKILICL